MHNNKSRTFFALLIPILLPIGPAFAENAAYAQLKGRRDISRQDVPLPSFSSAKSIYGENSMHEYYQVPESLKKLADSTVAFVNKRNLYFDPLEKKYRIKNFNKVSEMHYADENEDFSSQNKLSDCSGAYVGNGLVMTAGHCVAENKEDRSYFENYFMVFGWKYDKEGSAAQDFPMDAVYSIKKIETRALEGSGNNKDHRDFALVRMDREPAGRLPLSLETGQPLKVGQKVFTIGYPLGMAVKIDDPDQAQVYMINPTVFQTNMDVFGGNSGGPAFDSATGRIIGIVITAIGTEYSYELNQDFGFIADFSLDKDYIEYKPELGTVLAGAAVRDILMGMLHDAHASISIMDGTKYLVTLPKGSRFENRSLMFSVVTQVGGIGLFKRGRLMRDSQDSFGTGVMRLPEEIIKLVQQP